MHKDKFVIGITGGIGSGKSTVADIFIERGFFIIDADVVARDVLEKGSDLLAEIADHFGNEIIDDNGDLNRAKLASIVFKNVEERKILERLIHPKIISQIISQIEKADEKTVIIVVPLLVESGLNEICDLVIVVNTNVENRISRIEERNDIVAEEIRSRINAQICDKDRNEKADIIIDNNYSLHELVRQVDEVIKEIRDS